MTNQEFFDGTARHLHAQNAKSVNADGESRYRGLFGRKCALGWSLPDALALAADRALILLNFSKVIEWKNVTTGLLDRLQWLHDHCDINSWSVDFRLIAAEYRLKDDVINELWGNG